MFIDFWVGESYQNCGPSWLQIQGNPSERKLLLFPLMSRDRVKGRVLFQSATVLFVLAVYLYPTIRARVQFGATALPPIFAPDLSLYLNLSNLRPASGSEVINPYYRIPVPSNGSGYLKFSLAPNLFGHLNTLLANRTWLALLIWNGFWWALFTFLALRIFERFLPENSPAVVALGALLVMVFNFGILKTLLLAWLHLPSLAAFNAISLPFTRAFIPVIPCVLLLAYLGLQMQALHREGVLPWFAMGALQLLALLIFPYATLMMAGITAISLLSPLRISASKILRTAVVFGLLCTILDLVFLRHGSVGFYDNRSSPIHFQPQLLPHLIGGSWLLMVALTVAIVLNRKLPAEVKWPLVGLGAGNALLMLGDAVVPATTILLSHHAGHFVHLTTAILVTFLTAAIVASRTGERSRSTDRVLIAVMLLLLVFNGALLAVGNYRGFLPSNQQLAQLSRLANTWDLHENDLVMARSMNVDDLCGWVALLSKSPLLFCTDAEVMLTPQQNRDTHRFRQALYLYLTGEDTSVLERMLSASDPTLSMYRLGYWAEAVSQSQQERRTGIRTIKTELVPLVERVENRDPAVYAFFRRFERIVVIDDRHEPTFSGERLATWLSCKQSGEEGDLVLLTCSPK